MNRSAPNLFYIVGALLIGAALAVTVSKFAKPPGAEPTGPRVEVETAEVSGVKFEVEYRPKSEKFLPAWGADKAAVLRGDERLDFLLGIPVVNGAGFPSPAPGDTVRWNLEGPLLYNGQPVAPHRFQPLPLDVSSVGLKWDIRGGSDAPRDSLTADWSRAGRVLVTAHGDGSARVWNPDRAFVRTFLTPDPPTDGRKRWGLKAAVSPDGKTVATANVQADAVVLWEADTGTKLATLTEPEGKVTDLRFASDGCLLEARGGKLYARDLSGDRSSVSKLADVHTELPASFTFAGGVLAANDGRRVALSHPAIPGWPTLDPLSATIDGVTDAGVVAVSPDGKVLAVADGRDALFLYEAPTGKLVRKLWWRMRNDDGIFARIGCMAFFADGKTLAVGASDSLRFYDVESGRERGWVPTHSLRSLAVSGDGVSLAASAEHGPVAYLWRVADLQPK